MLLDLKLPDADGVDILATVRKEHPELQTIIVTGFRQRCSPRSTPCAWAPSITSPSPRTSRSSGCGWRSGEKTLLERENRRLRFQVQRNLSSDILTRSPVLRKVLRTIEMVAAARTPVLIEGRAGGQGAPRAARAPPLPALGKAFVDLNCAAVPPPSSRASCSATSAGLHRRREREAGSRGVADGGTLFLDEVGEMIPRSSRSSSACLDSGTFYAWGRRASAGPTSGSSAPRTATSRRRWRRAASARTSSSGSTGVKVVIPPLRERTEDIPLLVDHFAKQLPSQKRFTAAALAALSEYDWPGNVRELHFAIERAGLLAEGEMIDLADLPPELVEKTGRVPVSVAPSAPSTTPASIPTSTTDGDEDSEDGPDLARVRAGPREGEVAAREGRRDTGGLAATLYRWIKKLGI